MRSEVRRVLDVVEEVLMHGSFQDAQDLWDILSALRGPDGKKRQEKKLLPHKSHTIEVRRAAFPRLAEKADRERTEEIGECAIAYRASITHVDGVAPASIRYDGNGFSHFGNHINQAAEAINREDW